MPIQVGATIRKSMGSDMLTAASSWAVCEIAPESWDPEDPSDVEALTELGRTSEILLHSLTLNVLGDARPGFVTERILGWSRILGLDLITDHFAWLGTETHALGVFIPPIEPSERLQERVRALKTSLGLRFGLENISLSANDRGFCRDYHRKITRICHEEEVPILLDVENLRLDALSSGIPFAELLGYYEKSRIVGYHVAGSQAGEVVLDTHDQPVPEETLRGLLHAHRQHPAPVIYERDYDLDLGEIQSEVERIKGWLEQRIVPSPAPVDRNRPA